MELLAIALLDNDSLLQNKVQICTYFPLEAVK